MRALEFRKSHPKLSANGSQAEHLDGALIIAQTAVGFFAYSCRGFTVEDVHRRGCVEDVHRRGLCFVECAAFSFLSSSSASPFLSANTHCFVDSSTLSLGAACCCTPTDRN
jgi:hypothetical protein